MTNNWKQFLQGIRELLGSLFFPARCVVCDGILEPEQTKKGIHPACECKLYPILGAVCMHCGRPLGDNNPKFFKSEYESEKEYCYDCVQKGYDKHSYVFQAKALYVYKGVVKASMYRFKYSNKREYARFFATCATRKYGDWIRRGGVQAIVPVPMYPGKQKLRGYNQAECFAKELSVLMGIPMETKLVKRVVDTTPQKRLSSLQRKNNLKNAFQIVENVVQYECVMVVDDIYTTGSTAEAVARELIKQGTRRVYLMTVCIGGDM